MSDQFVKKESHDSGQSLNDHLSETNSLVKQQSHLGLQYHNKPNSLVKKCEKLNQEGQNVRSSLPCQISSLNSSGHNWCG